MTFLTVEKLADKWDTLKRTYFKENKIAGVSDKDKIAKLSSPRKEEFAFLETLFQNTEDPAVITGAMISLLKDAKSQRGLLNRVGTFEHHLTGMVQQVSDEDREKALAGFTNFMQCLYTEGDSRNGLKEDHPFCKIDPDWLRRFLNESYTMTASAYPQVLANITEEVITAVMGLPQTLNFESITLPEAAKLHSMVKDLIAAELAKCGKTEVADLSNPRRDQLLFLAAVSEKVNHLESKSSQSAYLAAAMIIVHAQINLEYKHRDLITSSKSAANGSDTYQPIDDQLTLLSTSLKLEDLMDMVAALKDMVLAQAVVETDDHKNHMTAAFTGLKPKAIKAILTIATEIEAQCRTKILETHLKPVASLQAESAEAAAPTTPPSSPKSQKRSIFGNPTTAGGDVSEELRKAMSGDDDAVEDEEAAGPSLRQSQ